jgi:maltose alpha-D-glucosyltransferase / alpha-amylase
LRTTRRRQPAIAEADPLWFKDAVVYQVHVRSFFDSNADGIGDIAGLSQKLDYLRDLGVSAVWLLPFYPSPLRDDGYDIADYEGIHPAYGNLADFKHFLREAHGRGLRVITELVVNHTSDQHAWFQRARRAPKGSRERDFYVWSDSAERYKDARIIFKDFETSNWTWDPVADAYYWHRFYSHQPDLNFANPAVRRAITRVMDQWLGLGVDGLRLDAVPYLHEREGTSCENLPETHDELRRLRRHIDQNFKGRMLLAEANQWPEDAAAYFGNGDECHMAFHFPLMPRMFMALRMEDRYPIVDILSQTPAIPESCQWAVFLRNHDELTLEMVTDEERDYMYRVYAGDPRARINLGIRRRLAPLLGNDRRRIELLNGLLMSLPGTPILYYGDELGMGDNIYLGDRNGVRTPMQWSSDRNAGFSRANPQQLHLPVVIDPVFNYETVNVEAQHDNPNSLLWWMRRLIALRKAFKCFGRGSLEFLSPDNRKVLAFVRGLEQEQVLVVANLSRHVQAVHLDLSKYQGLVPFEAFGRSELPRVASQPYVLTLGPHALYWLSLETAQVPEVDLSEPTPAVPRLPVAPRWESVLASQGRTTLEKILPGFLRTRRWFGGKARRLAGSQVVEAVPLATSGMLFQLLFARAEYAEGEPETYLVTAAIADAEKGRERLRDEPHTVIAMLASGNQEGVLHGGVREPALANALLDVIVRRRRLRGEAGDVVGTSTRALRGALQGEGSLDPVPMGAEQSNSSLLFGRRMVMKLFRKLDPGPNPELEIGTFLTEKAHFPHVAPLLGSLEYRPRRGEATCLAVLLGYVPNEGDAWRFTLDSLDRYLERILPLPPEQAAAPVLAGSVLELSEGEIPPLAHSLIGTYLEDARLLGQRTAELHLALASHPELPDFAPEPFTPVYQRSFYQSLRNLTEGVFETLRGRLRTLPDEARGQAEDLLARKGEVLRRFRAVADRSLSVKRTRTHGDLHLGQILQTGRDFLFIDFEGEPARPISTRRIKRSPLRDVAGMLRSFHYAAYHALGSQQARGGVRPDETERFSGWAEFWAGWVSSSFLRAYTRTAAGSVFLPRTSPELAFLMSVFLLEKAVYELGYELNNRPQWAHLPLRGIAQILESARSEGR